LTKGRTMARLPKTPAEVEAVTSATIEKMGKALEKAGFSPEQCHEVLGVVRDEVAGVIRVAADPEKAWVLMRTSLAQAALGWMHGIVMEKGAPGLHDKEVAQFLMPAVMAGIDEVMA